MRENIILDSWAIIAWLQGEAEGRKVKDLISWIGGDKDLEAKIKNLIGKDKIGIVRLFLNIINLGEVFYILGRRKGENEATETIEEIKQNPIEIVPVSNSLVFKAASFKIKYSIAYADAFAIATAIIQEGCLLTGAPELKDLEDVSIMWMGE